MDGTIFASLKATASALLQLGFAYYNGKVQIIEEELEEGGEK
jgi:hypothetical protein